MNASISLWRTRGWKAIDFGDGKLSKEAGLISGDAYLCIL